MVMKDNRSMCRGDEGQIDPGSSLRAVEMVGRQCGIYMLSEEVELTVRSQAFTAYNFVYLWLIVITCERILHSKYHLRLLLLYIHRW